MWFEHEKFMEFATHNWASCGEGVSGKLGMLADRLSSWNKVVFGNVLRQKEKLLSHLAEFKRSKIEELSGFYVS